MELQASLALPCWKVPHSSPSYRIPLLEDCLGLLSDRAKKRRVTWESSASSLGKGSLSLPWNKGLESIFRNSLPQTFLKSWYTNIQSLTLLLMSFLPQACSVLTAGLPGAPPPQHLLPLTTWPPSTLAFLQPPDLGTS